MDPLFVPEHTVVLPVVVPPVTGVTVTVSLVEKSDVQTPFCTKARNKVVCARLVNESEVVVLAIGVHVVPPLIDCSHLVTFPV